MKSNHLVEISNKNPETILHVLELIWIVTVSFSLANLLLHLNSKKPRKCQPKNIKSTIKTNRCSKGNDCQVARRII